MVVVFDFGAGGLVCEERVLPGLALWEKSRGDKESSSQFFFFSRVLF